VHRTLTQISVLFITTMVAYVAAGQQGIVVPVRAGLEGFSDVVIGLFGTAYALGFVIGCYVVPWSLRRVGHIRTFGVVASIAASSILLHGLLVYPEVWLVLRLGVGFAIAGAAMVIESWLNSYATNDNRGSLFSVYMVVYLVAVTGGQMSLIAFDPAQITMFVVAGMLFSLALLPTSLTRLAAPAPPPRSALNLRVLYRLSPVGAVGALAVGLSNGAFGTLAAVFAQDMGFSTAGIAIFVSLALVAGAVAQWPLGRLSDLIDRRLVIAGGAALGACAAIAMAVWAVPGVRGYVLVAGFGVAAYSLYGLVVAHANDYAKPEDFVAVSGGLLLLFGIGSAIGPLVASVLFDVLSARGLFVFTACVHGLLSAFTLYRIGQRTPAAEKDEFVAFARPTSPGAAALDPRADEAAATQD